ncbi:hypothetical protein HLI_13640 [Halobacillus litoralis]|uniref:Uncharacterized protein n=1 Tax=Halobacillus litoralis TaxID=45668 RepID=A0A410MER8_9BACI|nr:hypothetical protein HLI_13640 [Halobacillus litoralis]
MPDYSIRWQLSCRLDFEILVGIRGFGEEGGRFPAEELAASSVHCEATPYCWTLSKRCLK